MNIRKTVGAGVMSLGLVAGVGGFASAMDASVGYTGPDSNNQIRSATRHNVDLNNRNNLNLRNSNHQDALSGHANVSYNTSGGSALTGDAENDNNTHFSADVDNSSNNLGGLSGANLGSSDSASIDTTGPFSNNQISLRKTSRVNVNNNNHLNVTNSNSQFASSGNANVSFNTTGGDASTGDAQNSNSTSVDLRVRN